MTTEKKYIFSFFKFNTEIEVSNGYNLSANITIKNALGQVVKTFERYHTQKKNYSDKDVDKFILNNLEILKGKLESIKTKIIDAALLSANIYNSQKEIIESLYKKGDEEYDKKVEVLRETAKINKDEFNDDYDYSQVFFLENSLSFSKDKATIMFVSTSDGVKITTTLNDLSKEELHTVAHIE
jgi:hypothetical protein